MSSGSNTTNLFFHNFWLFLYSRQESPVDTPGSSEKPADTPDSSDNPDFSEVFATPPKNNFWDNFPTKAEASL